MNYLLFLQNIRESAPSFFNYFFVFISEGLVSGLIILPAIVFWCCDKKMGSWMLLNYSGSYFFNQIIKNTACVYRPWIRDSRLYLAPQAVKSATGYSYPSGHTTIAASVLESTAVWQRKRKWVVVLCTILILLVAFARNWLGAHTPADVLGAICCCSFILSINIFLVREEEKHDNFDWLFVLVGLVLSVGCMFYFELKSYPIDMDANGNVLVEPYKMITDCYTGEGLFAGFLIGWLIEKRLINFRLDVSKKRKIVRGIAGAVSIGLIYLVVMPLILKITGAGAHIGHLIKYLVVMLWITCIYPLIIKLAERNVA